MSRTERDYRPTSLDRAMRGTLTAAVEGPVRGLSVPAVADTLAEILAASDSRLSLVPEGDRWRRRPSLEPGAVVEVEAGLTATELLRHAITTADSPVGVTISGENLAVTLDHGVGDGTVLAFLMGALGCAPTPTPFGDRLRTTMPRSVLPRAAAAVLAPARLRAARQTRDALAPPPIDHAHRRTPADYRVGRSVTTGTIPPEVLAEIRQVGAERWPGVTVPALVTALLSRSLRAHGLPCRDTIQLPVDCRKYFPEQHRTEMGNASIALPICVDPTDPAAVSTAFSEVVASRWALAAYVSGELRGMFPAPEPGPVHRAADGLLTLAVSDVGVVPPVRPVPFGAGPILFGYADPAGPDDLTVLACRGVWGLSLAVSYYQDCVDAEALSQAVSEAANNPIGVLCRP